jgi:fatty acid synthase
MRAFGKLKEIDMNVGFEFSGVNNYSKRRVFGVGKRCIATHCNPAYTYPTPDFLSDAEAATIPVVYLTAYYALFEKARLQSGDTVLIHAGTGGVGQAAIRICISRGIHVLTTCHESKRAWLKEQFHLNDDQIGDSRSDQFITTVMNKTNGKGVTCVLNSLSGELQIASMKCIAEGGSFCEIGKYDIMQNTPIGQALFEKNISFFVIDLMPLLHNPRFFTMWDDFLTSGFMNNEIQALPFAEYHQSDIIQAFRDMSQAKHKGKIVIRFDDSNRFQHVFKTIDVYGQHHLITGGLGGLALCLAVRLSERGLSSLTLLSRSGEPCTQWQKDRIDQIRQNGTSVTLARGDVSSFSSYDIDTHIDVIWHAATVYDDTMFRNMTDQTWDPVQNVKVAGYNVLRTIYPYSRIVNFSSVVSYLGNPGQTNYAWANGELDNASYNNTSNTTTLQFGAIDNVGFIGKNDKNAKILQNAASLQLVRIDEIIDFIEEYGLDTSSPVFSFYSIAEKNKKTNIDLKKWSLYDSAHLVYQVLGGTIDSFVNSNNIPLNDLGMDSLSRVEIANQINDMGPSKPISPVIIGSCTLQTLTEMITK